MGDGLCGFGDCVAEMIGFLLIGAVVGVGGAYVIGKRKAKKAGELPDREESESAPAMARLGRRRRNRRPLGSSCGCGG